MGDLGVSHRWQKLITNYELPGGNYYPYLGSRVIGLLSNNARNFRKRILVHWGLVGLLKLGVYP